MGRNNADFQTSMMPIEELRGLSSENFEGVKVGNLLDLRWDGDEDLPKVWGKDYDDLKSDIAEKGIHTPLLISGKQLLDGHHRAVAAMQLGMSHVPVRKSNR